MCQINVRYAGFPKEDTLGYRLKRPIKQIDFVSKGITYFTYEINNESVWKYSC